MTTEDLVVSLGLDASPFTSAMAGVQRSLGGLGGTLATLAATTTAAFAFTNANEFDKSLKHIEINSRAVHSSMEALSDAIQATATESLKGAFSQNEVAAALAGVANQAESAEAALGLVREAGRLASITQTDLADTSKGLADVLSVFGFAANQAANVTKTLWAVSRQTGTGIEELMVGVQAGAPLLRELGFSFEETAAMAGVLKDAGVESAQGLLTAWVKAGGSGGLPGLLDTIREKLAAADAAGVNHAQALTAAFGKNASAALALVQNADALAASLRATATASADYEAAATKSVSATTAAKNQISSLATEIGQHLLPALTLVVGAFAGAVETLSKLGILDEVALGVGALTAAILLLKVTTAVATIVMGAFTVSMAPITLTVLGIAAAIAAVILVWRNWDQILGFFRDTIRNVLRWMVDFNESVMGIGKAIIEGIVKGLRGGVDKVVNVVKEVGGSIVGAFNKFFLRRSPSKLFEEFGMDLTEGLALGIEAGQGRVVSAMGGLMSGMKGAAEVGVEAIAGQFQRFTSTLGLFNEGVDGSAQDSGLAFRHHDDLERLLESRGFAPSAISAAVNAVLTGRPFAANDEFLLNNGQAGSLGALVPELFRGNFLTIGGQQFRTIRPSSDLLNREDVERQRVAIQNMTIIANSREGGEAAADAFRRELSRLGVGG